MNDIVVTVIIFLVVSWLLFRNEFKDLFMSIYADYSHKKFLNKLIKVPPEDWDEYLADFGFKVFPNGNKTKKLYRHENGMTLEIEQLD